MNKRIVASGLPILSALAFVAVSSVASRPALAGPKDFMVYAPGMGGNEKQAKPYLDTFLRELEKAMSWPAGSADGAYFEEPKAAQTYIDNKQPGYGMISPAMYLDLACQKTGVEPVATVVAGAGGGDAQAAQAGMSAGKYHVVVKEGTATDLKGLEGKKLISNHLEDKRFVSNVVFGGKIDADKHFKLESTNSPVKPFKSVDRGTADAALVDDAQLQNMKTLPFGKSLKVVYSSEALPPFPVVSFGKVVKAAERDQMKKVLLGLCATSSGGRVCKSLSIKKFDPVDAKAFKSALDLYCKP